MKQVLGAKHVFARAIKSPCKSFGEGDGEGEGDRPRQTKRPGITDKLIAKYLYAYNSCILDSFTVSLFIKSIIMFPTTKYQFCDLLGASGCIS